MNYIVYKTTDLSNGNIYIGVHKTETLEFDGYLGSGNIITRKVKVHGKENFKRETLFVFDNADDAFLKESQIVDSDFVKREDTYNLSVGGRFCSFPIGSETYIKQQKRDRSVSQETRDKIRGTLLRRIENEPEFAKIYKVGKPVPEEAKLKISETLKKHFSDVDVWNKGTKMSDEHRNGLILSKLKGTYFTPFGVFISLTDIHNAIGISTRRLNDLFGCCNDKVISKKYEYSQECDIGKTWKECGWVFVPISESPIDEKLIENKLKNPIPPKIKKPMENGIYHTPFGDFRTSTLGAKELNVSKDIIIRRCKRYSNNVIKKECFLIPKDCIGKTWKECGWFYEQI